MIVPPTPPISPSTLTTEPSGSRGTSPFEHSPRFGETSTATDTTETNLIATSTVMNFSKTW